MSTSGPAPTCSACSRGQPQKVPGKLLRQLPGVRLGDDGRDEERNRSLEVAGAERGAEAVVRLARTGDSLPGQMSIGVPTSTSPFTSAGAATASRTSMLPLLEMPIAVTAPPPAASMTAPMSAAWSGTVSRRGWGRSGRCPAGPS